MLDVPITLRAHLLDEPAVDLLRYLRAALDPGVVLTYGPDVRAGSEVLVAGRPQREHLTASDRLRAVIIPFAGPPAPTLTLMRDFPHLTLHNLHHNAAPTAEMAVTLLLAAAKQIVPADSALRQGDWSARHTPNQTLLDGKTALILGYGAIGQRVGLVCRALGMRVLAIRRTPEPDDVAEVHGADRLRDLLADAHALIICLPATAATEGLIGAAELDRLPDGAILVNVGRAAIVDQRALYEALRSGQLFAAGLDVWYRYPAEIEARSSTLPADEPFHTLPNVVLSPHRAGGLGVREVEMARMAALAAALNAASRGEPIPNRVDLAAGY